MVHKRKKHQEIQNCEQMKILSSPISVEIIQAFKHGGELTVKDLSELLGRTSHSLHYHVRKLLKIGFIVKVGTQISGARTEAIYDVVASSFSAPAFSDDSEFQKLTNDGVAALMRLAVRNFNSAIKHPDEICESGPKRNLNVVRHSGRLNAAQLSEVNLHLEELVKIFRTGIGNRDGKMVSLTIALTPVEQK